MIRIVWNKSSRRCDQLWSWTVIFPNMISESLDCLSGRTVISDMLKKKKKSDPRVISITCWEISRILISHRGGRAAGRVYPGATIRVAGSACLRSKGRQKGLKRVQASCRVNTVNVAECRVGSRSPVFPGWEPGMGWKPLGSEAPVWAFNPWVQLLCIRARVNSHAREKWKAVLPPWNQVVIVQMHY